MSSHRSKALEFPLVSIWSLWFSFLILFCCSAWKNLFQSSAIRPHLCIFCFLLLSYPSSASPSLAPSFPLNAVSASSLFPQSGAAELRMKIWGSVDLSWAHFNWTAVHCYIFFSLMGACDCVCVDAWMCVALQNSWPQKPRALAAHNYVLI